MSKWNGLVPYYHGNMQRDSPHPEYPRHRDTEITWKPAEEFPATLTFKALEYRTYAVFVDQAGAEYPVFMRDFLKLIPAMRCGAVAGDWKPCKRGAVFGLVLVRAH